MTKWTPDRRGKLHARHEPDTADLTPGDILASLALVVLVMITIVGVAML